MLPAPDVAVTRIPFRDTGQFAARDVAYVEQDARLRPFMEHAPSVESFTAAIASRKAFGCDRDTLVEVLNEQYAGYGIKAKRRPAGIEQLRADDAFTIVTAHQASLFLGPLYYVYKILSAVALSRKLAEAYPGQTFVPVFVLGAEDHDLDEIDHLRVSGQTFRWDTDQTGATGQMTLAGIDAVRESVAEALGDSTSAQHLTELLARCYREDRTLGVATGHFVAELFGRYGVVVANLNDARLKRNFAEHIRREVLGRASKPLIDSTVQALTAEGFSQQAHARDINFFYLQPGRRDRIERQGERYVVLDTELSFSEGEMRAEIDAHPERFSPNVVMRPLLQEVSLPNLAYVGGGGELAYWLERRSQFAAFGVPMPVLVRRDSAWWVTHEQRKALRKLSLNPADLLGDGHQLLRRVATEQAGHAVDFTKEREALHDLLTGISASAKRVDPTLEKHVLAKSALLDKELVALEKRLVRRLKKQEADSVGRTEALRAELLPGGGLQERKDSFMNLYARWGDAFFDALLAAFDPLDGRLKVFVEQAA